MLSETRAELRHQPVSHNLLGQRLGRKGQETRERILGAALRLLDRPRQDSPVTLSGIAREASVGMTTLYLYFPDLGALVLAALDRVMETAGDAFVDRLRPRWPDERLEEHACDFLHAHLRFWRRHAHILHMRNSLADASDMRFLDYRDRASYPLIGLLVRQMDGDPEAKDSDLSLLASVVLIGFERLATVITAVTFQASLEKQGFEDEPNHVARLLSAEARMIALTIRDARAAGA